MTTPRQRPDGTHTIHVADFYDDHGRPAPIPDDIAEWQPTGGDPVTPEPGQPPF